METKAKRLTVTIPAGMHYALKSEVAKDGSTIKIEIMAMVGKWLQQRGYQVHELINTQKVGPEGEHCEGMGTSPGHTSRTDDQGNL